MRGHVGERWEADERDTGDGKMRVKGKLTSL